MGYLDYRKKAIKDLGISPSTCSFNPGVIVANMTEWKHQRITKQLEKWMQKNMECVWASLQHASGLGPVGFS
jgi:lipopolysaccharide biosynthesis glycosyltransferase